MTATKIVRCWFRNSTQGFVVQNQHLHVHITIMILVRVTSTIEEFMKMYVSVEKINDATYDTQLHLSRYSSHYTYSSNYHKQ